MTNYLKYQQFLDLIGEVKHAVNARLQLIPLSAWQNSRASFFVSTPNPYFRNYLQFGLNQHNYYNDVQTIKEIIWSNDYLLLNSIAHYKNDSLSHNETVTLEDKQKFLLKKSLLAI
jgi:hypothetical protein